MKAILVIDMPDACVNCEYHEYYGGDYDWCHACRRTGTMPIENAETSRSSDCPLRPMPEQLDYSDLSWANCDEIEGWNMCLAEITGETE